MKRIITDWKLYIAPFFLPLFFFAGYFISQNSWDGQFFIYLDNIYSSPVNTRNIASVEKQMDLSLSLLEGKHLKPESQKALVHSARVDNYNDVIQFYLRHFLVKSKTGNSVLACQEYQTVNMTFIAAGMSIHGHVPKMILKTSCAFDLNQPLQIGPFSIPKKKILNSPLNRKLFKDEKGILSFSHVSVRWPKTWILSQIRFINNETNKDFTVSFSSDKEEDFLTLIF